MSSRNFIQTRSYEISSQKSVKSFVSFFSVIQSGITTNWVINSLIGFLLLSTSSFAQNNPVNPQRGIQSGASYSISDIENINTTNGNLMLNIPLVTLPRGRGEVGNSISLMYNSKLFDTTVEETLDQSGQPALQNLLKESTTGGWNYVNSNYSLVVQSRFETYIPPTCNIGQYAYKWRVFITMPDGSRKEFQPTGFDDIYNDGFYNVSPDGYQHYACPGNPSLYSSSGMVYYSTDGSYLKLVVNYVAGAAGNGRYNPWTLFMADGSKITGGSGVATRQYDRNGNYIEGLTDNFGRSISLQKNVNPDEDYVTMQGYNNQQLLWKVKWKTITVSKQYDTTGSVGGIGRGGSSTQTFSAQIKVVDKITLPAELGGQIYEFHYNTELGGTGWGELSSVKIPSGAEAIYEYNSPNPFLNNTDEILLRYPNQKTLNYQVDYDNSSTPVSEVWQYNINKTVSVITSPNGIVTTEYHGNTSYEHKNRGLVSKIVNSNGTITERIWDHQHPPVANTAVDINPYIKTEFTTIPNSSGVASLTKIVDYTVDLNGNQTEIKEYDWVSYGSVPKDTQGNATGIPSSATLSRTTQTEYYNSTATSSNNGYWAVASPNVRNAVKSVEIRDGSGIAKTRSEFSYDNASITANLTVAKTWDSYKNGTYQAYSNPLTSTNSVSTTVQYDIYGNPTLTTDAKGNQTQITYSAIIGPNGAVSDLYPTQVVSAYGTAIQQTAQTEYDFYTGLAKKLTALGNTTNENVVSETDYDAVGRPLKVKTAVNTPLEVWTQSEYDDINRRVIVRSDLFAKGDGKKIGIQHYDQLGRVRLARTIEDVATQNPYNENDGIKVQTRYLTGNPNSYSLTSNPYRAATATAATNEPSMGWTRSLSVNTGRHAETETFTGASLPAPWGGNTNSTGIVATDIDAERTLVTDQTGKKRLSKTNALGQLTDVWEITAADSATVAVSFPNQTITAGYQSSYQYDTLNNLTKVIQGTQPNRNFTYSNLSRLLSAQNPESGVMSYQYDANGNLTQKKDALNVQTNYTYDALNRVLTRSYTDGITPAVTYFYDNLPNAKGKLIKMASSVSTTEYTSFDLLGRVLAHKQTTDGTAYTTAYNYNLSGGLIEETYPSTRVVKNVLDNDGDLAIVQSKKNQNAGYVDYAKSFTYTAAGAVSSMQLGNGKWESTQFNSRLQPTQIALGTLQNGTDKLKLNFDYGTTTNNGNVQSQTITVPTTGSTNGFTAVQSYSYDSLNRLKSATETIGGTQSWKQTFTYDRFGNRNFDVANTTTIPSGCMVAVCNPTVDPATNRLVGYTFDTAGNTKVDATGKTFTYDAENKQVEVKDAGNASIGQYFYDGDGKRVKKYIPATQETTIFVYDASGKLVAEYATTVSQTPQVSYLTRDHLGSPRITTNANGQVYSRRDFMPFGEEITSSQTAQRSVNLNYGEDGIKQKFTSYERDTESELDFAQARYYSSRLGRFYSVDPENAGSDEGDPQSWNGYAYGRNNPTLYSDPDGLDYVICNARNECVTQSDNEIIRAQNEQRALFKETGRNGDYDRGNILNDDGSRLGTYQRISVDPLNQFFIGFGDQARRSTRVVGITATIAGGAAVCIVLCAPAAVAIAPALPGIFSRVLGVTAASLAANGCVEGADVPGGSSGGCGGGTNSPRSHNANDRREYRRIAAQTGLTERQVRDAFHNIDNFVRAPGNTNYTVDRNGNVSLDGEPLGNIRDYLNDNDGRRNRRDRRGNRERW